MLLTLTLDPVSPNNAALAQALHQLLPQCTDIKVKVVGTVSGPGSWSAAFGDPRVTTSSSQDGGGFNNPCFSYLGTSGTGQWDWSGVTDTRP